MSGWNGGRDLKRLEKEEQEAGGDVSNKEIEAMNEEKENEVPKCRGACMSMQVTRRERMCLGRKYNLN